MLDARRLPVPPAPCPGNAGIMPRYPIDLAKWIWLPGRPVDARQFAEFRLAFTLDLPAALEFEVSADQRFILRCDGKEIGRGPDRAELAGWSAHRYAVDVADGDHALEAIVWWLPGSERPYAQTSARPAFAVRGLGEHEALLSTGVAAWSARELRGWGVLPKAKRLKYHVIGCGFDIEGAAAPGAWETPETVAQGRHCRTGEIPTPWRLEPSPLPEQGRTFVEGAAVRAVQRDHAATVQAAPEPDAAWSAMLRGEPTEIPANTEIQILVDLCDYVCGYPRIELEAGAGSVIDVEWAESLYVDPDPDAHSPKGHRAEWAGKQWLGFGDRVRHPGGRRTYEIPWWRSGRWIRFAIRTAGEPLVVRDARPLRTGYPFARAWEFECDRPLNGTLELCERALRNCVHETFVDCPYYEQLQYVGDTRVQALAWLVATGDPRPVRRALELFDRSRWVNGFVAERCPSHELQMSATYSLVFPTMFRDYAWWTADRAAVQALLPGMRGSLEAALACLDDEGLPSRLPGWLFVDWVARPDWSFGMPGGHDEGAASAPVALHLPVALDAAARVETACGDPLLARRWSELGSQIFGRIMAAFWDTGRGMLSDNRAATRWSEHAQALALDCSWLDPERRRQLLDVIERPPDDLARASVYFSHHVHEALLRDGRVDAVLARLGFWDALAAQGFLTCVEAPEPARSDCHGWGAHPLYHCLTALAGVRPSAPFFQRARIAPQFGPLTRIRARVPHPDGAIEVELERAGEAVSGRVRSPVPVDFVWGGVTRPLPPGESRLA